MSCTEIDDLYVIFFVDKVILIDGVGWKLKKYVLRELTSIIQFVIP